MNKNHQGGRRHPEIDALIFDLDGVLSDTRKVHRQAWRGLFDEYFGAEGREDRMSDGDYDTYIDGKPRYEGVRAFLASRGIEPGFGHPEDAPGHTTVCALGNRKNVLFQQLVREQGVDVFEPALKRLKEWHSGGLPVAVVSSSKNCRLILEKTGLSPYVAVRVDGQHAAEKGLKGKPDPEMFLEAARALNARPERCIVFEDATVGVRAGQAGFFGLVVGVARESQQDLLLEHGADFCVDDFSGLDLSGDRVMRYFRFTRPMVFSDESELFEELRGKKPVFFLDYDGTLTPIVQRPEDAILSDDMRNALSELARHFTVAVVSGRDLEDIRQFIRLDSLIYSGSHGYITSGPDGLHMEHEDSEKIISKLDKVEDELLDLLKERDSGIQLDRKRYAIALHYRNAAEQDLPFLFEMVDKMLQRHEGLKKGEGKKVIEIKPDIDWHKGKAVLWILETLGLDKQADAIPVFIGDDLTDEDAFEAIGQKGIGILVENHGQDTAADYSLKNVFQVEAFFRRMIGNESEDKTH